MASNFNMNQDSQVLYANILLQVWKTETQVPSLRNSSYLENPPETKISGQSLKVVSEFLPQDEVSDFLSTS